MIALSILNLGNLSNIYGFDLGSLSLDADEKFDGVKDAATDISRTVSRRDIATQMSPEGSIFSSPERKPSFLLPLLLSCPLWSCRVSIPLNWKSGMFKLMNGSQ